MLVAEYDYDTDIAVQREESLRIGIQKGIQQGIEQGIQRGIERGIEQGIQQGFSNGAYQKALETARNLLSLRLSIENIAQATGLSAEDIANLSK